MNHGKKFAFEEFLYFYFGLKHPKLTTPERKVLRLQVPLSSNQCFPLFSKNHKYPFTTKVVLLFSIIALLFSGSVFLFNRSVSNISRMSSCFIELPFSFPEVLSFSLLCTSFSKNDFFQLIVLLLVQATERGDICLTLALFPLRTLYWPTYDAFLITLKPLHTVFFLCIIFKF